MTAMLVPPLDHSCSQPPASVHSSSSPPTSRCGGITPRNVDPALLHPPNASLTAPSARVGPVGRHTGGSGGCARDNRKGVEESLSVCVCVCLDFCVGRVQFPSYHLCDRQLRDAGSAEGPETPNVSKTKYTHSSCHLTL